MSGAGACSAWNTLEGRVTSDLLDQPPNLGVHTSIAIAQWKCESGGEVTYSGVDDGA